MLDTFLRFSLPRFFSALCEDVYKFLIACKDSLHNLVIVETCGVDYKNFQLNLATQHWWRVGIYSRTNRSFALT